MIGCYCYGAPFVTFTFLILVTFLGALGILGALVILTIGAGTLTGGGVYWIYGGGIFGNSTLTTIGIGF